MTASLKSRVSRTVAIISAIIITITALGTGLSATAESNEEYTLTITNEDGNIIETDATVTLAQNTDTTELEEELVQLETKKEEAEEYDTSYAFFSWLASQEELSESVKEDAQTAADILDGTYEASSETETSYEDLISVFSIDSATLDYLSEALSVIEKMGVGDDLYVSLKLCAIAEMYAAFYTANAYEPDTFDCEAIYGEEIDLYEYGSENGYAGIGAAYDGSTNTVILDTAEGMLPVSDVIEYLSEYQTAAEQEIEGLEEQIAEVEAKITAVQNTTSIEIEISNGVGESSEIEIGIEYTATVTAITGYDTSENYTVTFTENGATLTLSEMEKESIYGYVTYDGSGVEGITLTLYGYTEDETVTDENGYYEFEIYSGQDYEISITETEQFEGQTSICVTDGTLQYDIELTLKSYTITTTAGEGGVITGTFTAEYGSSAEIIIEADQGYRISTITVNDSSLTDCDGLSSYTYIIESVTEDITIAAEFSLKTYTVTITASDDGTIEVNGEEGGGDITITEGGELTLIATPYVNYRVSEVSVDGTVEKYSENDYVYEGSFTVSSDMTIEITFSVNEYSISVEETAYGIVIVDSTTAAYGAWITITVTPDDGYNLSSIAANGNDIEFSYDSDTASYTATVYIISNTSIYVYYSEIETLSWNEAFTLNEEDIAQVVDETTYIFSSGTTAVFTAVEDYTINGTTSYEITATTSITSLTVFDGLKYYYVSVNLTLIIDETAPQISAKQNIEGWTNSAVTIEGNVSDDTGIASVIFIYGGEEYEAELSDDVFSITFEEEMNEEVTIYAVDLAGGISEYLYFTVQIDKTVPEISSITFAQGTFLSEATYYSDDITITASAEDDASGIQSYVLYKDGSQYSTSDDGSFTLSADDFEEKTEISVSAIDVAGNISEAVLPTAVITNAQSDYVLINGDRAEISITTDDEATNEDTVFTISISDSISGIQKTIITLNGETVEEIEYDEGTYNDAIVVSTQGYEGENELTVTVTSNTTAVTNSSATVLLDMTAPTIESFDISETTLLEKIISFLTFGTFYNNDVTITVTASDALVGVAYITLYADSEAVGTIATDSSATFTISEDDYSKTISTTATDLVGNTCSITLPSEINSNINNSTLTIEKIAPTINIDTDAEDGCWYSKDIEFLITIEDSGSGLSETEITINDEIMLSDDTLSSSYTDSVTYTINTADVSLEDSSFTLVVTACDNAGNETETEEFTVFIDKDAPEILGFSIAGEDAVLTADDEYGYYFNEETEIIILATDNEDSSGLYSITYYLVNEDEVSEEIESYTDEDGQITLTIPAQFKGWIYAKATDMVGNTSEYVKPAGIIIESKEDHAEETHITFSVSSKEEYYSDDVTVTVTVTDTYSGIKSIKWSVKAPYDTENNQTGTEDSFTVLNTDNNLDTKMRKSITVRNDSNDIVITVKMTDNSGNSTTKSYTLNIDKTNPTISVSYDNNDADAEYTSFYKGTRTATITVTERNFDASAVTAKGISISKWTMHSASDPDQTYYTAQVSFTEGNTSFSIYLKDEAGNSSNTIKDSFTIDLTTPKVTVTFDNNSAQNGSYYKASRTATITIEETNFDANRVEISGGEVKEWQSQNGKYTATIAFTSDGTYTFDIKVTDKAGNIYDSYAAQTFVIDKTYPTINISYDTTNASEYYNSKRTATITITELNFDPDCVIFTGTYGTIGSWNSNGSVNTVTMTFDKDEDYDFSISVTDKAGNHTEYDKAEPFTVDLTMPTMVVTYDGGNSTISEISNTSHYVTITINEHNFDSAYFTALIENQIGSVPSISEWSSNGDIHTATIDFTDEGIYNFTLSFEDQAGNETAEYVSSEFTIDLTAPEITITGVVDKSAYRGSVTPTVVCTDDNYDSDGVDIILSGIYHDATAASGSRTEISNGQSIIISDIEHTQDCDDIYTLEVTATDLAGNTSTQSITYSVNRYGSNFTVNAETEEYIDSYYHDEENTITIIETNVDEIESLQIAVNLDGSITYLVEGEDYAIEEEEGEWHRYIYTLDSRNFSEEGIYDIIVTSTDIAGNEQSNKTKECSVSFAIDKTAPSVVITGIEDEEIYDLTERSFSAKISDNIAAYSLTVYIDDVAVATYIGEELAEIDYTADFTLVEQTDWHTVKAVATDAAGNESETEEIKVLVSTNFLNRFIKSDMFIWLLIAMAVMIIVLILLIILGKKKNSEKEED